MNKYIQKKANWSVALRWLHLGLAVGVVLQFGLGFALAAFSGGIRTWLGLGHEVLGLVVLGLCLLHLGWLAQGRDGGIRRLVPWKLEDWQAVAADLKALTRLRLPPPGVRPGLPGLVQGLGLGLVTLQGLVGLGMFLVASPQGELPLSLAFLKAWHQALGWGVLGYLGVHLGMALVHLGRRDGVVTAMLPWR